MNLVSNILLIVGCLTAAFYCLALSKRVSKLMDVESGVGRAISRLSQENLTLTKKLDDMHVENQKANQHLLELIERTEKALNEINSQPPQFCSQTIVHPDIDDRTKEKPKFGRRKPRSVTEFSIKD